MKRDLWFILFFTVNILLHGQGLWAPKAYFAAPERKQPIGFCIGNRCYLGTGGDIGHGAVNYDDFWEWDPFTDTWIQKATFPGGPRTLAVAFSIGHKGYIATGWSSNAYTYNGAYNDLWEYDPVSNSWTQKASMPCPPTMNGAAFVIGNKAYIVTDSYGMWEWDQFTNTWSQKTPFPPGFRHNALAFSIGNKGYFGTGSDGNSVQKDFWEWDQSTDTWLQKADFPHKTGNTAAFTLNNKGYVGFVHAFDTTRANKFWEYDPSANTWTLATSFPGPPRRASAGFSSGTKAYIAIEGYWLTNFWEYDPFQASAVHTKPREINLKVFPNPTVGFIRLSLTSQSNVPLHLSLKNSLGQVIHTERISGFSGECTKTISLQDHAKGVYLLELVGEKECFTQRVIVE